MLNTSLIDGAFYIWRFWTGHNGEINKRPSQMGELPPVGTIVPVTERTDFSRC